MDATTKSEEQKEISPNRVEAETAVPAIATPEVSTAVANASKTASVSSSGHRQPTGHSKPARSDKYAEKRLARKKKMRAAHRRRLRASHAKG